MAIKNTMTSATEIVANIPITLKDSVFRLLWMNYIKEDVCSLLWAKYKTEDELDEYSGDVLDLVKVMPAYSTEEVENLVDTVARRYVFDGEYDCNLPQWQNLENLIKEEMEAAVAF